MTPSPSREARARALADAFYDWPDRPYDKLVALILTFAEAERTEALDTDHLRHAVHDFLHPYKHGTKPWTQLDEADLVAFIRSL